MTWIGWTAVGVMAALFVLCFVICCPDKLPWNRRRGK